MGPLHQKRWHIRRGGFCQRRRRGGYMADSHHVRHICRKAASIPLVNLTPSVRGELRIRRRNPARRSASRGKSLARSTAIFTNCSSFSAASSRKFKLDNWLHPARPTIVSPIRVTTGTPIQNESRLVV